MAWYAQSWGQADASWWQCTCGFWSEGQKKKCSRCGLKKAWATSAGLRADGSNKANSTRKEDEEVAAAAAAYAKIASRRDTNMEEDLGQDDRQEQDPPTNPQDKIKEIDAMLSTLTGTGPTTLKVKQDLLSQKEEAKKEITLSKPIHIQLESCRGAVTRALKRLEAAEEKRVTAAELLAQAEAHQACMQVDLACKKDEMAKLEATVIGQARHADTTSAGDSLQALKATMQNVICDMHRGQVDQQSTVEATRLMEQLFTGLTTVANKQTATAPQQQKQPQPQQQQQLHLQQQLLQQASQTPVAQMLGATAGQTKFWNPSLGTDPGATPSLAGQNAMPNSNWASQLTSPCGSTVGDQS